MKKKNDSKRSTSDYIPQLDDYGLPPHIEVHYSKAKPNRFARRVKFTHGGKSSIPGSRIVGRRGAGPKPGSEPIERHTITLLKSHAKRLRALDKNLSRAIRKLIESTNP